MTKIIPKKEDKIYLTSGGLQNIQKELSNIKNEKRPRTVERLALARSQGDLSENNEYAAAKEELAFIDGRIEELEEIINNSCVIKERSSNDCVCLGCKVTIKSDKGEIDYSIVGEWEADPIQRKVSHQSPLGKALISKKVGEEVEFDAPAGKIVYKIIKIQ